MVVREHKKPGERAAFIRDFRAYRATLVRAQAWVEVLYRHCELQDAARIAHAATLAQELPR